MARKSAFSLLRTLLIIFPIGSGLILTGLGTTKLSQATKAPSLKPLPPYGILAFSSEECEVKDLSIYFVDVLLKENQVKGRFYFLVSLICDSKCEETFGFQIPNIAELNSVSVESSANGSAVEVDILDANAIFAGNNTSLIYLKFVTLPEGNPYQISIDFTWRDMIIKQSFSTYDLIIPISMTELNTFHEHLPNVHPIGCPRLVFHLFLPTDCELVESIPPPKKEFYKGEAKRNIEWSLENLGIEKEELLSEVIRVRLELREELELRNRLMFDSGLYMGLGVGLVFSGIHEGLKIFGN